MAIAEKIQNLDSFAKTHENFRTKTVLGGLVTIFCGIIIAALVAFEWMEFQKVIWRPELIVDRSRKEQMTIYFDISFPKVPCFALNLDVMDAADDYQNNINEDVVKFRLLKGSEEAGEYKDPILEKPADYCGSCYDAKIQKPTGEAVCCNSCSAVFAAYEYRNMPPPSMDSIQQCIEENWKDLIDNHATEGCRFKGSFKVNKVSGNFHFAPGKSYDAMNYHMHDVRFLQGLHLDFSHKINYLTFGEHHPELKNPLDNTENSGSAAEQTFKYYLKIVPTDFNDRRGGTMHTNQYAVTQSENAALGGTTSFPSVFFYFEISPLIVIYTEYKKPLISFLTGVCAVVGGIYTVAAIVDGLFFHAERRLRQKVAMGKAY